jgi:hypothetical protein
MMAALAVNLRRRRESSSAVPTRPNSGALSYTVITNPANGYVGVNTNGIFAYYPKPAARVAPAATATTTDNFTVVASNGKADAIETVTAPVSPVPTNTVIATINVGGGEPEGVAVSPHRPGHSLQSHTRRSSCA